MKTIVAAAAAVLTAMPALAAEPTPQAPPPAVAAIFACRDIRADAERLACFDRAAGALDSATKTREVVVLDRAEIRRTRKSLFGFTLPRIGLFGGGKSDPTRAPREVDEEEINAIDAIVAGVSNLPNGRYAIMLEEGGTWRTTEGWSGAVFPRRGQKVHIQRGPLGSYMLKVQGGRAIRAERAN